MSASWEGLKRVFRLPLGRRGVEGDVATELQFHLEERIEELMAGGLSRTAAEREARERFGDVSVIGRAVKQIDRRMVRKRSLADGMEALGRDVRFAFRALRRSPGFTLVAVLTLALGIGANTAIFSAVNGVLLRPLAVPDLDRLYVIRQDMSGLKLFNGQLTPQQAEDFAAKSDLVEVFAGVSGTSLNLTGAGEPQRIEAVRTMGRFFDLFSLAPAAGRFYRPDEAERNAKVAVLSHGFWQSWAGGDPKVIGRSIELSGQSYVVVGVLPEGFGYRRNAQVFVPLVVTDQMRQQRPWMITALVRAKPGLAPAQVAARVANITAEWQADSKRAPSAELGFRLSATPLTTVLAGQLRPVLLVLMAAVVLVLLIACGNVANLQLVRGAARSRELAVRAAMGAGRWPIMRQLIVESGLLALAGGVLGILVGLLAVGALRRMDTTALPALRGLRLDGPVLAFAGSVTLFAVLVSGLVPTLRTARPDLHGTLREGARGGTGPARGRLLRLSAAGQVALSLMLLLGAGLLIRSLSLLLETDPGFRPAQVLTFRVSLPGASYPDGPQRVGFFDQLTARLGALPGVETSGAISDLPFGEGRNSSPFRIEGKPIAPGEPERHADMRFVTGDYFRSMGIPLIRGRGFGPEDRSGSQWVAMVDESLVKQHFGSEDPLGRVVTQGGPTATIIGVVGAVKHGDLTEPDKPVIYYSYRQAPWTFVLYLTVRADRDPLLLLSEAKAIVAELDPRLPLFDAGSMQERVEHSLGPRRLAMTVLGAFAAVALLLALLGVYGVLSYSTSRRAHELGVRMALGALPGDLVRMVLGSGLALTAAGIVLGGAGFLVLARFLSGMLYGVTPRDPATIAAGVGLLLAGALLATLIPARRAARIDPVEALREE